MCVELDRNDVAHRSIRLWQAAGRPAGRHLEFWLQAEVELLAESQARSLAGPDQSF